MSKHKIEPRQYPFRGGTITAKEAADRLHISVASIYNRLKKCGDDMERLFCYYEARFGIGGVIMI